MSSSYDCSDTCFIRIFIYKHSTELILFFQCCSFHAKCTQFHTSMTQYEQLYILFHRITRWMFRYIFNFIIYALFFTLNIWFPFNWYSIRISQLKFVTLIINNTRTFCTFYSYAWFHSLFFLFRIIQNQFIKYYICMQCAFQSRNRFDPIIIHNILKRKK